MAGEVWVVITFVNGGVGDLEILDAPPQFDLAPDQECYTGFVNGGDSVRWRPPVHEHHYQGQTLRHAHPGGPHGYFEHPEDPPPKWCWRAAVAENSCACQDGCQIPSHERVRA